MKLLLLHFFYGSGMMLIGIYAGKMLERKKRFLEFFYQDILTNIAKARDQIKFPVEFMKWRCMVCQKLKPDCYISVISHDISKNGVRGTCIINVRYCNDELECFEAAHTLDKWQDWP